MVMKVQSGLSLMLAIAVLTTGCGKDPSGTSAPTVSWSPMTSVGSASLSGIWGASASNVFAVGDSGRILHFDGTAWDTMPSPTTAALSDIRRIGQRRVRRR